MIPRGPGSGAVYGGVYVQAQQIYICRVCGLCYVTPTSVEPKELNEETEAVGGPRTRPGPRCCPAESRARPPTLCAPGTLDKAVTGERHTNCTRSGCLVQVAATARRRLANEHRGPSRPVSGWHLPCDTSIWQRLLQERPGPSPHPPPHLSASPGAGPWHPAVPLAAAQVLPSRPGQEPSPACYRHQAQGRSPGL